MFRRTGEENIESKVKTRVSKLKRGIQTTKKIPTSKERMQFNYNDNW